MSLSMQFIEDRLLRLAEPIHKIELALFPRGSVLRAAFKACVRMVLWRKKRTKPTFRHVTQWSGGRVAAHVRSIVLLKLDHIGDLVTALPAARMVRDAFPDAHVTLVCGQWNAALASRTGLFDAIVPLDVWSAVSGQTNAGPNRDPGVQAA